MRSRLAALVACTVLLAMAAGCGSDQPANEFTLPTLPDGTPAELLAMAEDEMRQELIDELGLGQVLTEDVLAEMDAARDQAALQAFPQLGTEPDSGAAAQGADNGAVSQVSPQASVRFTSAVGGGGPSRNQFASNGPQLAQYVPTGEYDGAMIGTSNLAGMWAYSKNSAELPSGDQGSKTYTDGSVSSTVSGSSGVEGSQMVSDVTITTQKTIDGKAYTEVVHVVVRGDACPDADGKLRLELKLDRSMTGGGATASRMWNGTITAQVGDDAYLKNVDYDVTTSAGDSTSGGPAPAPRFGWSTAVEQVRGGEMITQSSPRASTGTGVEGLSETEVMTAALRALLLAHSIADLILPRAQDHWRNGGCVVIEVPEGTKKTVKPNEVRSFTAHVKQKWEGVEVPAPVTVTKFSGKKSVDPMAIDPAPDKFTVTTGGDGYATVSLETVSRRGRDTEAVEYTVGAAFRVVGGLDYFQVDQVVCDVTRRFRLQGPGITMVFDPDLNDPYKGTYEYSGNVGGAPASGSGTYVIQVDDTGGTMTGTGTGSITSPLGTFSASGTEKYTLTPAEC